MFMRSFVKDKRCIIFYTHTDTHTPNILTSTQKHTHTHTRNIITHKREQTHTHTHTICLKYPRKSQNYYFIMLKTRRQMEILTLVEPYLGGDTVSHVLKDTLVHDIHSFGQHAKGLCLLLHTKQFLCNPAKSGQSKMQILFHRSKKKCPLLKM